MTDDDEDKPKDQWENIQRAHRIHDLSLVVLRGIHAAVQKMEAQLKSFPELLDEEGLVIVGFWGVQSHLENMNAQ